MAIILAQARPALRIAADSFEPPNAAWQELETHRTTIEAAIRCVGRLESSDDTLPFLATTFLVGNGLALTTRHVAATFSRGVGDADISLRRDQDLWINFKAERDDDVPQRAAVSGIAFIHPYWDVAALRVETDRPGLVLESVPPEREASDLVVVIGYPALDLRNTRDLQDQIFGGVYKVKRLMPGKTTGMTAMQSYGREVLALTHDASTLGGTAGAPVVDMHTGRVLGINFAGQVMVRNYAVPAWELLRDPRVRHHLGLVEPDWMHLWNDQKNAPFETDVAAVEDATVPMATLPAPFLSYEEILTVCDLLIEGFPEDKKIAALFEGMPPEFVAALPHGDSAKEKLLRRLFQMNRTGLIGDHSPLYFLLKTAVYLRRLFPEANQLQHYLKIVQTKERALN